MTIPAIILSIYLVGAFVNGCLFYYDANRHKAETVSEGVLDLLFAPFQALAFMGFVLGSWFALFAVIMFRFGEKRGIC